MSVGSAKVLAASEAVEESKVLKTALSALLCTQIPLFIALPSWYHLTLLSTWRNAVHNYIRADFNVHCYEYETDNFGKINVIPGRTILKDPGTKTDSPLSAALRLT